MIKKCKILKENRIKGIVMKILKGHTKILLMLIDIIIIGIAYYLTSFLVYDIFYINSAILKERIINTIFISIFSYEIFLNLFQSYKNITKYETGWDYVRYILICLMSSAFVSAINMLFDLNLLSVKMNLLAATVIAGMFITYRLVIRFLLNSLIPNSREGKEPVEKAKNLLIIGGGNAASQIIKSIKSSMKNVYNIIGIIDDDKSKWNYAISGIPIIGGREKILEICKASKVDVIFFSISNIKNEDKKDIIHICQNTGAKIRILPSTEDIIKNKKILENLRDVEIEDILGREPIVLDNKNIKELIENKIILVTGGGGSIGSELCRQIAKYNPAKLVIFDIYENNLYNIEMELKANYPQISVVALVGSVRDKAKLENVFDTYKPYIVFHAAAHKHVPLMEASPLEAIKNNIFGTYNVVNLCDKHNVKRFTLVSTDKAVNPTNIMGATKRMCEMIVQAKNRVSNTEYVAVRFGNVLGSNGSVVPLFKKQIASGGPVTVTHREITRFFMTIPEAVSLILQATAYADGGEIFVLDMGEPVKIYDLAESLIKLSGFEPNVDMPIKITGLRPGEKLYEELLMSEEGLQSTKHNKIFVAEPLDISQKQIEEKIEMLKELIKDENISKETIKRTIKQVVPTYHEPKDK